MTEQNIQPLVSVIMPVYNGEKTIKLAINSLLNQTYKNWICIIVNDGSTDETKSILDSINDSRFKIIHLKKNVGRGAARQVALDNSEGDYLAYLDADDFYHTEKLSIQVEVLNNEKEIALVSTVIGTFNKKNELIKVRGRKGIYIYHFGDHLFFTPATSMVRLADAIKHKYSLKLNAAEDVDYFSRYLEGGKKYLVIEKALYYYEIESTTYSKILEYTGHELKRVFSMYSKIGIHAFTKALVVLAKYLAYLILIPVLGVDFFLKRRGSDPSVQQIQDFKNQCKQLGIN